MIDIFFALMKQKLMNMVMQQVYFKSQMVCTSVLLTVESGWSR